MPRLPRAGTAERDAALAMVGRRIALGADKAYDVADFVDALRALAVTPHIAVDGHVTKTGEWRKTRIHRRTTRHPGYTASQRLHKRIEQGFGWIKTSGGLAKTRHRGLDRVGWMFTLTAAANNLVRLPKPIAEAAIRCPPAAQYTPSDDAFGPVVRQNQVVLPAPLGSSRPTASPRSSVRQRPRTTGHLDRLLPRFSVRELGLPATRT